MIKTMIQELLKKTNPSFFINEIVYLVCTLAGGSLASIKKYVSSKYNFQGATIKDNIPSHYTSSEEKLVYIIKHDSTDDAFLPQTMLF